MWFPKLTIDCQKECKKNDTNSLMHAHNGTLGLKGQYAANRTGAATLTRERIVRQTHSKYLHSTAIPCSSDFNHATDLLPPQQRAEQLLFLQPCDDEVQMEQLERPRIFCERSKPASVSLKNAFSLNMTER